MENGFVGTVEEWLASLSAGSSNHSGGIDQAVGLAPATGHTSNSTNGGLSLYFRDGQLWAWDGTTRRQVTSQFEIVEHGADANVARPNAKKVEWRGSVLPNNKLTGDDYLEV